MRLIHLMPCAAVLAGVKLRSSQSSPCSARWRAPARGSGLLRRSL